MGLTKREKFLVFAAAVVAVVVLTANFAIAPMIRHIGELSDRHSILVMDKTQLDMKIMNEAAITRNHENSEEKFNGLNAVYPVDIPNEEIAGIITDLCHSSGFYSMRSLSLSGPNYIPAEGVDVFYSVTVSVAVTGRYGAVKTLIDKVAEIDYIRLSQVVFTNNPSVITEEPSVIPLTFEFIILKEIDVGANEGQDGDY
jgi:Tfp pilus assembly protein PilO